MSASEVINRQVAIISNQSNVPTMHFKSLLLSLVVPVSVR